ncbi:lysine transporter LysM [Vibrio sp. S4M6]|uniref:OapA family protein n=1 Tax=Vibrio sinus TaxID=2946865 RepID=UPI00202A7EB2|nr:LysM-like peptidoglycan-binding domain-containing protein [Vibrio sinus]MCL9780492.1 lysine transporter LysM [Vibrio sinus]
MNRRKKQPKQVDYLDLIKTKWADVEWQLLPQKAKALWSTLPKLHRRLLSVLIPVVLVLIMLPTPKSEQSEIAPNLNQRVPIKINPVGLSEQMASQPATNSSPAGNSSTTINTSSDTSAKSTSPAETQPSWKDYVVKAGDTLAKIFRNNGISMSDLNDLIRVEGTSKPLSHIQKGQLIRYKLDSDGQLDMLQLEKASGSVMFFRLSSGGFAKK